MTTDGHIYINISTFKSVCPYLGIHPSVVSVPPHPTYQDPSPLSHRRHLCYLRTQQRVPVVAISKVSVPAAGESLVDGDEASVAGVLDEKGAVSVAFDGLYRPMQKTKNR